MNNGTHSAVTKDSRRLNTEEGQVQAAWVALVMRDTITSFLRRDRRVVKPFRSVPWSSVHYNTDDNTGRGILATYMEHNGNDSSNLKGLALEFLDIINRMKAFWGIGWGHNKRGATFVHKRVVTKLIILSLKIHTVYIF